MSLIQYYQAFDSSRGFGDRVSYGRKAMPVASSGVASVARMERSVIRGSSLPLAEARIGHGASTPILRQNTLPCVAMERRMRPFVDLHHEPMFDRIEMNIIDMPYQVRLIPDGVLPITPLPKTVFTAPVARSSAATLGEEAGEQTFAALPTSRKIDLVARQRHKDVQMIGKHNDGIHRKRTLMSRHTKCISQQVDGFDERAGSSIRKCSGKKERAARHKISSIADHVGAV